MPEAKNCAFSAAARTRYEEIGHRFSESRIHRLVCRRAGDERAASVAFGAAGGRREPVSGCLAAIFRSPGAGISATGGFRTGANGLDGVAAIPSDCLQMACFDPGSALADTPPDLPPRGWDHPRMMPIALCRRLFPGAHRHGRPRSSFSRRKCVSHQVPDGNTALADAGRGVSSATADELTKVGVPADRISDHSGRRGLAELDAGAPGSGLGAGSVETIVLCVAAFQRGKGPRDPAEAGRRSHKVASGSALHLAVGQARGRDCAAGRVSVRSSACVFSAARNDFRSADSSGAAFVVLYLARRRGWGRAVRGAGRRARQVVGHKCRRHPRGGRRWRDRSHAVAPGSRCAWRWAEHIQGAARGPDMRQSMSEAGRARA